MTGIINDHLRASIGLMIATFGLMMSAVQRIRILRFKGNQERLRQTFGIIDQTPTLPYGPEQIELIEKEAHKCGSGVIFAMTSGSTGQPKRLLYTKGRLRSLKFTFSDMFCRACYAFQLRRTSLYVFSSFSKDESLTSLLIDEEELPPYFATLQAPYRVQQHRAISKLVEDYGPTAVRLWILAISNPGVLYSTNPSTISTFFDELVSDWAKSSKLVKDWCTNPQLFESDVRRIARRLGSKRSKERLHHVATSKSYVSIERFAPGVVAYICWTGGYVKPFLDRLDRYLPSPRYRLIPMYSMSTETVETVSHFSDQSMSFLPIASHVLYEFIDHKAPEHVLRLDELQTGRTYEMVVSDKYGLRRYRTDDLFLCTRKVRGLPDLRFIKRRSLEYSFTGEKLTSEQVDAMFYEMRKQYPEVTANTFLTCVPSATELPHYNVLLVGPDAIATEHLPDFCDNLLRKINCEYDSKRTSGRLGPIRVMNVKVKEFTDRLARDKDWEAQFKFLPLYRRTWESGLLEHLQQGMEVAHVSTQD